MTELLLRLSKAQLDKILTDADYFWTLRNECRDTDQCIDIDKAWHGIHYLFTKDAWHGTAPECWIVFGDTPIAQLDSGYGPARYINPSQVEEVWKVLNSVSEDDLRKRFGAEEFDQADIYPSIWQEGDQAFEYLMGFYHQLVRLYKKAAQASEYVLMLIT